LIDGVNEKSKSSSVRVSRKSACFRRRAKLTLVTHVHLILEDRLQELQVAQVVAGGLLQAHVQRGGEAGEPQLAQTLS
jgi:hypothetical protein